jgi:hypothetical protein
VGGAEPLFNFIPQARLEWSRSSLTVGLGTESGPSCLLTALFMDE